MGEAGAFLDPFYSPGSDFIAISNTLSTDLITRFLDFARPRSLRLEKTDLHAMLDKAIEVFDREKSGDAASVTVFKNYSPDVPPVRVEAELMVGEEPELRLLEAAVER